MRKLAIVILTFFLLYYSNRKPHREEIWGGFYPGTLEEAFKKRDSALVKKWINSLRDSNLSEVKFYSRVVDLSVCTNFYYGNADPTERDYWDLPIEQRRMKKRNVAEVYRIYSESCLFMEEVDYEKTLSIQDLFWNNSTELSSSEILGIRNAIDSICSESFRR